MPLALSAECKCPAWSCQKLAQKWLALATGVWNYNTAARINTGSSDKETPDTTAEASPAKVIILLLRITCLLWVRHDHISDCGKMRKRSFLGGSSIPCAYLHLM